MRLENDHAEFDDYIHWNAWHGCRRKSEGCANCYFIAGNESRGIGDSNIVKRSVTSFTLPVDKKRDGSFKIPSGKTVMTTMSSDFFIEEADEWRNEAWNIIRKRRDLYFMILTKRPERIAECLPADWNDGYGNVCLCVSVENQKRSDERLPILMSIQCARRCVFVAPMISAIDMSDHLSKHLIQDVMCGGEYGDGCRQCDYDWVLSLKEQCMKNGANFHWHNAGGRFVKNGVEYKLTVNDQRSIRRSSEMDYICMPFGRPEIQQKKLL